MPKTTLVQPAASDERRAFGERLDAVMTKAGISTATLSKMIGVSYEMARRYRNGDAVPEYDRRNKLARALGVSPIWLETGQADSGLASKAGRSVKTLSTREASNFEMAIVVGEGERIISDEGDFAVRLADDSMTEQLPGAKMPILAKGDLVIISTTMTPLPGDLVLVRRADKKGDAAIRKLVVDASGRAMFVAADDSFPSVDSSHGYEMVGVVIALQAHRRR